MPIFRILCPILAIILALPIPTYALFGLAKGIDVSAVKLDIADNATSLASFNMNTMKSLADIKASIGDIDLKLTANANAMIGVNNKISTLSSGRDTIQTTTNDSKLLEEIFKGLFGLMSAICAGLFAALRAKERHIQALIKSNEKKQDKQDEWERGLISKSFGYKVTGEILEEANKEVEGGEKK